MVVLLVGALMLAGCGNGEESSDEGSSEDGGSTHTLTINADDVIASREEINMVGKASWDRRMAKFVGGPCDDSSMSEAKVVDGEGTTLGLASDPGVVVDAMEEGSSDSDAGMVCRRRFTINDVKEVDFYAITIGPFKAGDYSLAEMKANNWSVDVSRNSQ